MGSIVFVYSIICFMIFVRSPLVALVFPIDPPKYYIFYDISHHKYICGFISHKYNLYVMSFVFLRIFL